MSHRHLRLHRRDAQRRAEPLNGFGIIAHEVNAESDDMERRDSKPGRKFHSAILIHLSHVCSY